MADNVPGGWTLVRYKSTFISKLLRKIIGRIKNALYKGAVFNSFEPMRPAKRAEENGQLMVTEIRYGTIHEQLPGYYLSQ